MTEVFEGPQLTPPRVSLITAADIVPVEGNERWYQAFDIFTDGCDEDSINVYEVCPPADADPKAVTNAFGTTSHYQPYVIYSMVRCSTLGSGAIQFFDRAQRRLLTNEAKVLEEILWTGAFDGTDLTDVGTVNPFLADNPTSVDTGSRSAKNALARLDQAIADCSSNRGMIHVRPVVLGQLLEAMVVRREGNVYLSPMDNIVVPGRGYPGTGPASQAVGATEWMYGHPGIVQVRRGPIVRLGEDDLSSQVDRYVNDKFAIVERVAHVAFDTCCYFTIEFDSPSNT
jgi:hypothetical protein